MRFPELPSTAADALRGAGVYFADLMTPTLRIGVTGLARAGKTVFITALVRNLVAGGRLPFFGPNAEGRILRAFLEPQPDAEVPRFDFERHIAALSATPPTWPESTRRISELRVTIEYEPEGRLRRRLGPARLHVDIVDYPGEWLIDLAMMDQSFAQWSADVLALAGRRPEAAEHRAFAAELPAAAVALSRGDAEQIAIRGAEIWTRFLRRCRDSDQGVVTVGPGRFLTPGDKEGAPELTFFPLPADAAVPATLRRLLDDRYESYKRSVVRPFFSEHFSRIDRQIVLVDALGAINRGPRAVADLERALEGVLRAFRPDARAWLHRMLGLRQIRKLLIAATKADHLPSTSHDRLEAILALLTGRAAERATGSGAAVTVLALAALRATREGEASADGQTLPVIIGTPLAGETLGGVTFDGATETAVFPGDLPEDAAAVLDEAAAGEPSDAAVRFLRFRPPQLAGPGPGGDIPPAPHIRLDRALDFLISDRLA